MSLGRGFVDVVFAELRRGPVGRTSGVKVACLLWFALLWSVADVFRLVSVLRSSLRGLFGRSFLRATVPLPVPSWTPADHRLRPRSGGSAPDTDKIYAIVLRAPGRSTIGITPGRQAQVQGTHRAGSRAAGIRTRSSGESTPSPKSKGFSVFLAWMLHFRCLTRRIGLRWEPTRAPRRGLKRNEGGRFGSPLFLARAAIPL